MHNCKQMIDIYFELNAFDIYTYQSILIINYYKLSLDKQLNSFQHW